MSKEGFIVSEQNSSEELRFQEMRDGAIFLKDYLQQWVTTGLIYKSTDVLLADLEKLAGRMVDFKSGSLARKIRLAAAQLHDLGVDYPEYLLHRVAEWYLYACRVSSETNKSFAELRNWLDWAGWNYRKEQLMILPQIKEDCQVMSVQRHKEESLRINKTWLLGLESKALYLHMEYLAPMVKGAFDWYPGKVYSLRYIKYPGEGNMRILILEYNQNGYFGKWPFDDRCVKDAFVDVAEKLADFPLAEEVPTYIGPVGLHWSKQEAWTAYDASGSVSLWNLESKESILSAFQNSGQTYLFGWISDSKLFAGSIGFNGEFIKI